MTVSLIVGAVRTLAKFAPQPAADAGRNQRTPPRPAAGWFRHLHRRCCLIPMEPVFSPVPVIPRRFSTNASLDLPGALPLGLDSAASYHRSSSQLREGDHFSLYTDGLLEARNASGELYGFERLEVFSAPGPAPPRPHKKPLPLGRRMTSLC